MIRPGHFHRVSCQLLSALHTVVFVRVYSSSQAPTFSHLVSLSVVPQFYVSCSLVFISLELCTISFIVIATFGSSEIALAFVLMMQ